MKYKANPSNTKTHPDWSLKPLLGLQLPKCKANTSFAAGSNATDNNFFP